MNKRNDNETAPHHAGAAGGSRAGRAGGFSLIELLTVISIIGVLAAIGVGVSGVASRKMKEARVRAELNLLVTAIENYKSVFGSYPPDNNRDGSNFNAALNPLYYELIGTLSTNQGRKYRTLDESEWMDVTTVSPLLNLKGFVNSATWPNQPKKFLNEVKKAQRVSVPLIAGEAAPLEVLVVPVEWPSRMPSNPAFPAPFNTDAKLKRINPWRYVSTHPTNNPEGFDLWAEVVLGKQTRIFGNWKE